MKNIKIKVQRIGSDLIIKIPEAISEMMDWDEGDTLEIPFHEIVKVPTEATANQTGDQEVIVRIGDHPEKIITREDVIQKLENPKPEYNVYRTASGKVNAMA